MKISRQKVFLIVLASIAFSFAYITNGLSRSFDIEEKRQSRARGEITFDIYHGPDEMNYWDFGTVSFIVIGLSCSLSAIWLENK